MASVLAAQTTSRGGAVRGGTMCCGAVAVAAGMQQLWSDAILDPSLHTILCNTTVLRQITAILLLFIPIPGQAKTVVVIGHMTPHDGNTIK